MINRLMLWFQPISYLCFRFHFGVSVDIVILQCLPLLLQSLHLLCHLPSLLFLKRLLFNSLWMRWRHSLCGRLSFSSSSSNGSFMDNASSLSTSAFHTRIHLHHHHPHHLSSLLCLYLDTPIFHLLHYVPLFSIAWMVVIILDYVFALDDMELFWLFVISWMICYFLILWIFLD